MGQIELGQILNTLCRVGTTLVCLDVIVIFLNHKTRHKALPLSTIGRPTFHLLLLLICSLAAPLERLLSIPIIPSL